MKAAAIAALLVVAVCFISAWGAYAWLVLKAAAT